MDLVQSAPRTLVLARALILSGLLVLAGVGVAACGGAGAQADAGANADADTAAPPIDTRTPDAPDTAGVDATDGGDDDSPDADDAAADTPPGDLADGADVGPIPCTTDGDCLGRLPGVPACERAACDRRAGFCTTIEEDDGAPCDDGDACSTDSVCRDGACVGRPLPCDDDEYCTEDRCDPRDGCLHTPRAAACDDGDPCTEGDACQAGLCLPGRNVCPCEADADCAVHDDACAGAHTCAAAGCVLDPATRPDCDVPSDGCTFGLCDPGTGGCVTVDLPDGHPCDDGNACTAGDICGGGRCNAGAEIVCDDDDPCTTDRCDAVAGCLHTPNQRACDDHDSCTETDRCEEGVCLPGTNNRCLDETCSAVATLACGVVEHWTRDADVAADLLAEYACDGATGLGGPEITWVVVAPFTGEAILRLDEAAAGTRAVLLEAARRGCDPAACRAAGVPGEDVRFALTAGAVYYVVVDAASGVERDFVLSLDCVPARETVCDDGADDDRDGATDCDDDDCAETAACDDAEPCPPRWALTCGAPVAGHTDDDGPNGREGVYGCVAGAPVLEGPEVRYSFTPPVNGAYRARLLDRSGPFEVVVGAPDTGGCGVTACRGRGAEVPFEGVAGEPLAIVVDGPDPSGGAFGLVIDCPDDRETACDDDRDDDGDGATDCDDVDCAERPACAGVGCARDRTLGCGDVVTGVTNGPGHTRRLDAYPCSLFQFTGPEVAYPLDVPAGVTVAARLLAADEPIDAFLLRTSPGGPCSADLCISQGDEVAEARAEDGFELVAVVDGHEDAAGPFTLAIECVSDVETSCTNGVDDDADGDVDCVDVDCVGGTSCPSCAGAVTEALACDSTIAVSTFAPAATEAVVRYGCNANPYPGAERIYSLEPGFGGDITLSLDDESGALDLILLEDLGHGCNPAACLGTSPYRVRFRSAGGRRYFVAIDGYAGEGGGATLTVDCEDQ